MHDSFPKHSLEGLRREPREQVMKEEAIPDLTHEAEMVSGALEAFERVGLELHPTLRDMFLETGEHRFIPETSLNNRRGSGLMQASRFLADVLQRPAGERLCMVFHPAALAELRQKALQNSAEFQRLHEEQREALRRSWQEERAAHRAVQETEQEGRSLAEQKLQVREIERGVWTEEYQEYEQRVQEACEQALFRYEQATYNTESLYDTFFPEGLPAAYQRIDVRARLSEVVKRFSQEEDVLIGRMIQDALMPYQEGIALPAKTNVQRSEYVGTCTTAETYFLSMLDPRKPYSEPVVMSDATGEPLMILKAAGERSAMTLRECVIDGVRIPAGSLIAPSLKKPLSEVKTIEDCTGFRFLRLTTLAISPEHRRRAFGPAMRFQEMNRMYQANTATIEQLRRYARGRSLRAHYS